MRGGKRVGAGRPLKADQIKVSNLAMDAIAWKHGSLEKGFKWLLSSEEPSLIKFAFEHAFGKPTERIEHSTPDGIQILFASTKRYEAIEDDTQGS